MMTKAKVVLAGLGLAVISAAQSTAGAYGQCGGSSYTGPTSCGAGYACTSYSPFYYQCIPGTAASTTVASTSKSTTSSVASATATTTSSQTTSSSLAPSKATTTAQASTSAGIGTPTTLLPDWYWIRAVESPYYHSYLQTLPTATPGGALLDSAATAGQFNIVDGQLIYNTGSEAPLYMWVEDAADKTQRALATWFNGTASTYGSFAFSGDTVTWTDPDVARPNTAAFYVCPGATGEQTLFVNTGAYLYQTPSGCYDIDIHYYGGSTAVV